MVMVCFCTRFILASVLVPGWPKMALGEGPCTAQAADSLDRVRECDALWCHEESADTHHDHVHRGQDKLENDPQVALESVPRGVWQRILPRY